MKVLYLVPQPSLRNRLAAYTFLDEEINGLTAAGVKAYVLSTRAAEPQSVNGARVEVVPRREALMERARSCAFLGKVFDVLPKRNLLNPRQLYRPVQVERVASELVRREHIDVIHSHFGWPAGFGGALARRATGVPLVASLRGTDILVDSDIEYGRRANPHYDRAIRTLARNVDRTICFSRFMRDKAIALGVPPARATIVRKGVDASLFRVAENRESLKERLGLAGRPLLLSVGGLIPRKGVHIVLEALARLRDTHDFVFAVCGDGPQLHRLQRQAQALGIAERTRFLGRVDRTTIPDYFAACDFLIHAPTLEAAGNVLFEAMASGRPVIAAAAGGPEEYVEDGRTGFVVPPGNPEQLAARVAMLLDDAALRERLGAEALRQARAIFTYERMTRDIIAVYEGALQERRHPVALTSAHPVVR